MHKKFFSNHCFSKHQVFSLFPIVKMNANYTEICLVGSFRKCYLFNFSEIFTILLWSINNSNSSKKSKQYFLRQKFQKLLWYRNCIVRSTFGRRKFNVWLNIWGQNTETEKKNGFWYDRVNQNKIFSFKIELQPKKKKKKTWCRKDSRVFELQRIYRSDYFYYCIYSEYWDIHAIQTHILCL